MKTRSIKMVFLLLSVVVLLNATSHADVLTCNAHWWRAGSIGRGWNIKDSYKVISNAVLKNEKDISHLTLDLNAAKFDPTQPMRLEIRPAAPDLTIKIYDSQNNVVPFRLEKGGATVEVSAGELEFHKFDGVAAQIAGHSAATAPARIELQTSSAAPLQEVDLYYALAGSSDDVDMAPPISAPKIQPAQIAPEVQRTQDGFIVKSTFVTAEFSTSHGLQLKSLRDGYAGKNILIDPTQTQLFITEINGKRFGAQQWQVAKVLLPAPDEVQINLILSQYHLAAQFEVTLAAQGLKLGLQIQNQDTHEQSWKTVFPQIGGLSISDQPENDYYLYPMYGGLVQNINANLRFYYGAGNESLWQMMDIFSPALGTGMSLRSLDDTGMLKGMAFRKGATNPAYSTMVSTFLENRTSPDYLWNSSLSAGPGSSMGFEYSPYAQAAGKTLTYPDAMIEMHPGDWHDAMRTYADWAHKAWQWRPLHTKLDDVWRIEYLNIKPSNVNTKLLFSNGKWYDNFAKDDVDMGEWDAWWQWGDKGPFGISLKKVRKEGGSTAYSRLRYRIIPDPVTGKPVYIQNFGETNRYNESMGGLPALQAAIKKSQDAGVLVQLYTSPMLADTNTSMGQYGPKFGVVNPNYPSLPPRDMPPAPRDGHVIQYYAYRMDVNNEEFIDMVAKNMARLVKDTNADAIRLDELGFGGFADYSTQHSYLFGGPGQHWAMRAMAELAKRVHAAASAVKPDFVLTAEYPGADIQAAQLDGALMSENRRYTFPGLRPLPVDIFRFYFPEIKLYEYHPNVLNNGGKVAFWNAVGTFLDSYPDEYYRVLKENGDAFRSQDVEPLIPTLAKEVYANRFTSGDKQITLFYNASRAVCNAPLMKTDDDKAVHYFDLLNGQELPVVNGAIQLQMNPDDVAAVARLPRSLKVMRASGGWTVTLLNNVPNASVALCDGQGDIFEQKNFVNGKAYLDSYGTTIKYIKLFSGKYLVDAMTLP